GGSLQVTHDFDAFSITSISAYQRLRSDNALDSDAVPRLTQQVTIHNKLDTFTQELQLKSAADSKVQRILGGYDFDNEAEYAPLWIDATTAAGIVSTFITSKATTESWAAFGQASYEILPKTTLTLGARYTKDKRDDVGTTTRGGVLLQFADQQDSWKK